MATRDPITLTLQRALARRTIIDQRISEALSTGIFISVVKGTRTLQPLVASFKNKEQLVQKIQSSQDSVLGLIAEKQALINAITKANFETTVSFLGETITILELINKKEIIKVKKSYLQYLTVQQTQANKAFDAQSNVFDAKVAEESKGTDTTTLTADQKTEIETLVAAKHQPFIVSFVGDTGNLQQEIDKLRQEISDFEDNVDSSLSEINAITSLTY